MVSRRWNKVVFALAITGMTACSSNSEEPLSADPADAVVVGQMRQSFELRSGQTARVGDTGLLIGFRGVAQDSRCPADVACVWAGDAELQVTATIGRMAWTPLTLHTTVDPRSAKFREHTITVIGLEPKPRSDARIPATGYVVTLRVE